MSTVDIATLSLEQVSYKEDLFIDVRSPAEYEEYSLPNAINMPLFSNEERARVGTTYKQKSRHEAMEVGLSIFAPKWPEFYRQISKMYNQNPGRRIVVYCWRGGMRSKTMAATLGLMNIPCYQLEGGIRSFRQYVQEGLERESKKERSFVVIAGHTGTRKTEFLKALQDRGFPVLDLEELAGHRGSIFGHIGMNPNSQKQFDYLLLQRLQELSNEKTLIIEAESKRIGHIVLPEFILNGKQKGIRVELDYPFWKRVDYIYQTYQPEKNAEAIYEAILHLQKWFDKELFNEIIESWKGCHYKQAFSLLLEHYYDPRYRHAFNQYKHHAHVITFETFTEGMGKLITCLESLKSSKY
ncbi:tRNA 2-selenouridine(34) synthase MnmH [Halalkalibacter urbisdiaboli]|uniref:tRNA 2-selenouridine(34) synthase MnmH n=1 Tax=Halalkalibacter urbisdiaboli TaxID=1960589 RepID=UPI0013FD2CC9|nr:tRNA 2-selenouridine(34) synthase MnmH [Halalkalibacter urbisdiaboli]